MADSRQSHDVLWKRATVGDAKALDELLVDYLPHLRAFVRSRVDGALRQRESCSDVVQSVCRELVSRRESFEFRGEAQFRGWLFTSALNKIREKHRFHHAGRRDVHKEDGIDPLSAAELALAYASVSSPASVAAMREDVDRLEKAFDELSDDHREVISLARIAGLPLDEVGQRMGRSPDAVRMLLGRALLALGALLAPGADG